MSALTYWACGGDIVATHGRVLCLDEARRLHDFYRGQAIATDDADADRLALELSAALSANLRWRRASHQLGHAVTSRTA